MPSTERPFNRIEMERFITYARVSTQSQGKSGLGLEAQQRDLDMYLSQVLDHEVTQSFVEVESGKDDANRPMLRESTGVGEKHWSGSFLSASCAD